MTIELWTPEDWDCWLDRWVRTENREEFGRRPHLTDHFPVLHSRAGYEYFLRWADHPHLMDDIGSNVCDHCGRRMFLWAGNAFLGAFCLLCFTDHAP